MEQLTTEDKTVILTVRVTPTMEREINKMVKKHGWRRSPFLRVAIMKEMERLANEKV